MVPFVVRGYLFFLSGEYSILGAHVFYIDFLSFYKSVWLLSIALISIAILISLRLVKIRLKESKLNIMHFIFGYFVFLIFSTLTSQYRTIAVFGYIDRFEGLLTILSYISLFIYSYIISSSYKPFRTIVILFGILACVQSIIGFLQFTGYFTYFSTLINYLIIPNDINLEFISTIFRAGRVDLTMYNPNYAGHFSAIVFPIFLVIYYTQTKKLPIVTYACISVLSFFLLIVTRSRAGFVSSMLAIAIVLTVTFLTRKNKKTFLKRSGIVVAYIIVFLLANLYSGGALADKAVTLDPRYESEILAKDAYINDIKLSTDEIKIDFNNQVLSVFWIGDKLNFLIDDTNQTIYRSLDKLLVGYNNNISYSTRIVSQIPVLDLNLNGITMIFAKYPDTVKIAGARNVFYDEIIRSETALPFLRDSFGSYRGYIWKKTIPLLKDNFWIGNGPDTLAAYFPHYDVISMLNAFGRTNMIVDKPHNYYLQVAHDTGVLSLLTLLTLFGYYIAQSIRLQFKVKTDSELKSISLAILAGVLGYLIAAIFNDSTVHVAPLFWVLLGTGFATNRLLIENKEAFQDNLGLEGIDPQR